MSKKMETKNIVFVGSDKRCAELYVTGEYGIFSALETRIGNKKRVLIKGMAGWYIVPANMFKYKKFFHVYPSDELMRVLYPGWKPSKKEVERNKFELN